MLNYLANFSKCARQVLVSREPETPLYSIFGQAPSLLEPQYYHVERVSDRSMLHLGHVPAHSHPHLHQLSFWIEGGGRYFADDAIYPIRTGTLCWMPSGTIHGFEAPPPADAVVLSISDDFARDHLGPVVRERPDRLLHEPVAIQSSLDETGLMQEWFAAMEREYRHGAWGQAIAIGALARLIFVALVRHADHSGEQERNISARATLLSRFRAVLEEQLRQQPNVEDLAQRLGTTPYLLNSATREAMGMRASDVIRARVMQEAKRLLLFTMISVSDICHVLGYGDPSHFTRAFKAYTGQVPSAWRAERVSALERSRPD